MKLSIHYPSGLKERLGRGGELQAIESVVADVDTALAPQSHQPDHDKHNGQSHGDEGRYALELQGRNEAEDNDAKQHHRVNPAQDFQLVTSANLALEKSSSFRRIVVHGNPPNNCVL